ncbi:Uma2 family endonuclease [Actinoplanes sp. CA-131856]
MTATTSDLENFPVDNIRRELFNGRLHTSSSFPCGHQALTVSLGVALTRNCPRHLFVTHANEVELDPHNVFIPDLMTVDFEATRSGAGKFPAAEVTLVAEIVSPGTQGIDRATKPAAYARAGIPHFWLIETLNGLEVTTFELKPETQSYEETGVFSGDDTIRVGRPWAIEIPLASVRPRNL